MKRSAWMAGVLALTVAAGGWAQDDAGPAATFRNGGFERPDLAAGAKAGSAPESWFYFSSTSEEKAGVTEARKRSGSQAAMFKAQAGTNAFQGIAQKVALEPGQHWMFTAYVMNDPEDPIAADAYGQIGLEWQDGNGQELSRTYGPTWKSDLAPRSWQKFMVEGDAPDGAGAVVGVVTFFSQGSGGHGTFYVDDCDLGARIAKNEAEPAAEP